MKKSLKFDKESILVVVKGLPRRLLMSESLILYFCVFFFIVLIPVIPTIATSYNLISNLSSNIWPLFAVAIGQTFVLIIAGIDLSQGAVISLTSIIAGLLLATKINPDIFTQSPSWGRLLFADGALFIHIGLGTWAVPTAILVILLIGALIGLINGSVIAYARVPPFMVTLVMEMVVAALALFLVKSESIIGLPNGFTQFGADSGSLLTNSLIITIAIAILAQLILSRTLFGRWLYAIGTNIRAAVVSGVPTKGIIVLAYMFSGFCAALASILYSGRMNMGRPDLGSPFLLDIIGAAVIGGSSLGGGKGKIIWTFFGVLFLSLMGNALNLLNVSYFWIQLVKGCIILMAALLDVARTRTLQRNVETRLA
jgi:ribose/xylose/arabinose/galactoside ABC-type transport system permease subunit